MNDIGKGPGEPSKFYTLACWPQFLAEKSPDLPDENIYCFRSYHLDVKQ